MAPIVAFIVSRICPLSSSWFLLDTATFGKAGNCLMRQRRSASKVRNRKGVKKQ